MLKPTKYTNVNVSVIAVSCELIKIFQKNQTITYTDLLNKVMQRKGVEVKSIFLPALSFLFLLGKVSYFGEKDIITYNK